MSVRFINQIQQTRKCEKHGSHESGWDDACVGHDTFDQAVTCQELMSQTLSGNVVQSELVNEETLALTRFLGALQDQSGATREFRILRRTTTDEVLDA